jgi:hypothetical protein
MKLFSLFDRLPSEAEVAAKLQRVEEKTGIKAQQLTEAAEKLAVTVTSGLRAIETRAARLERFAEGVNARFESRPEQPLAHDVHQPATPAETPAEHSDSNA